MKATPSGSWVRIETGITPSQVAALYAQWTEYTRNAEVFIDDEAANRMWSDLADDVLVALEEALNPRLTVGQARAFGWETANAATTAARGAWNEEGVAG